MSKCQDFVKIYSGLGINHIPPAIYLYKKKFENFGQKW